MITKKETLVSYTELLEDIIRNQYSYKQILSRILEEAKKETNVSNSKLRR